MKNVLLGLLLLLLLNLNSYSQKNFHNWVLGDGAAVTFDTPTGEPEFIDGIKINAHENSSVVSDKSGNLLMYSYDNKLLKSDGSIIDEGDNIDGHTSSTQGSIIIMLDEDKFLRIGATGAEENRDKIKKFKNLSYVLISKNGSNYSTSNKINIIEEYLGEKLLVIRNIETNDLFLLVHNLSDLQYHLFGFDLIEEKFIKLQSIKSNFNDNNIISRNTFKGYLKSSLDGSLIASCIRSKGIEFLKFDKMNKQLFLLDSINIRDNQFKTYTGEFSSCNQNFYLLGEHDGIYAVTNIHKLETESPNVRKVKSNINTSKKYTMLLGPNKKIYISNFNYNYLSSIENLENPDDIHYIEKAVDLENTNSAVGLPNIPTTYYNFIEIEDTIEICQSENIKLSFNSCYQFDEKDMNISWSGPNGFASNKRSPIIENAEQEHSGVYEVTISNEHVSYSAETFVKILPEPKPNIEVKPAKIVCTADKARLVTYDNFETYEWSTGDTYKETTVYESGTYRLTVTDENGCIGYSEVKVIFAEDLTMDIIAPDTICPGTEVEISADRDYAEYEWSTEETTKSINITEGREYWLHVITEDGCEIEDTIFVEEYPEVSVELKPAPTSICQGDTVTLEPQETRESYSYDWSNGKETKSIEVTKTGTYKLLITDTRTGCRDSTEITINVEDKLEPKIEGKDICGNETVTLTAIPNDESYSYEWNTGETTPSIEVSEAGEYSITVTKDNCSGEAEFEVEQFPLPEFTIEGDRIICEGETTTLTSSKEFEHYEWSNGGTKRSITVGEGDYTLTVTDSNGCTALREIEIEERKPTFDISKNSIDFGKVYISETKKDSIEVVNTSGFDVVFDDNYVLMDGQTFQFNKALDPDKIGQYNEELTLNITDPCDTTLTFSVTAEVYARVTLSTINIHTEIGATETIPYYIEAEADLGEQEFNITTDIDRDLFFTNDSYQVPSPQAINQQRTQIHEQTGTILLAELYEYPITFPQVEFDNPYIEAEADSGEITFDEICIHDLRLIHTYAPTEVSVAPNPARDVINIDISTGEEGNFTIELISTEGRTTYTDSWNQSSSSKNIQIDTRDISTGVYQLRLTTEGHIYRKEVVVVE